MSRQFLRRRDVIVITPEWEKIRQGVFKDCCDKAEDKIIEKPVKPPEKTQKDLLRLETQEGICVKSIGTS
jgi:hypothetical protein